MLVFLMQHFKIPSFKKGVLFSINFAKVNEYFHMPIYKL